MPSQSRPQLWEAPLPHSCIHVWANGTGHALTTRRSILQRFWMCRLIRQGVGNYSCVGSMQYLVCKSPSIPMQLCELFFCFPRLFHPLERVGMRLTNMRNKRV